MIVMARKEESDVDKGPSSASLVLTKSDQILFKLCPFLYPPKHREEIQALEFELGTRLGAPVQCLWYHFHLTEKYYPLVTKIASQGTSKVEAKLFQAMVGKEIGKAMRKHMNINEETAAISRTMILDIFQEMSDRLEKKKNVSKDTPVYLVGNSFTAADLTFAALSFHVLNPPEMSNFVPPFSQLPPVMQELSLQLQETTAGKHALRMYQQHRGTSKVVIKSVDQNRFPWKELGIAAAIMSSIGLAVAAKFRK